MCSVEQKIMPLSKKLWNDLLVENEEFLSMRLNPTASDYFSAAVICCTALISQPASALPQNFIPGHMHNEVDHSRYVDTDWSPARPGWIHIHTKASNGWRFDPMHAKAIIEFRDANNVKVKIIEQPVWCQASLGGGRQERNFDMDIYVGDVWANTTKIVYGSTYDTHPADMPQMPSTIVAYPPPWETGTSASLHH